MYQPGALVSGKRQVMSQQRTLDIYAHKHIANLYDYIRRVGKSFHLTMCADCDCLLYTNVFLKVRGCNVFFCQSIIIHYKYLTTICALLLNFWIRRFTHFFAQPRGVLPSPRPMGPWISTLLQHAPPHTSLICTRL